MVGRRASGMLARWDRRGDGALPSLGRRGAAADAAQGQASGGEENKCPTCGFFSNRKSRPPRATTPVLVGPIVFGWAATAAAGPQGAVPAQGRAQNRMGSEHFHPNTCALSRDDSGRALEPELANRSFTHSIFLIFPVTVIGNSVENLRTWGSCSGRSGRGRSRACHHR